MGGLSATNYYCAGQPLLLLWVPKYLEKLFELFFASEGGLLGYSKKFFLKLKNVFIF